MTIQSITKIPHTYPPTNTHTPKSELPHTLCEFKNVETVIDNPKISDQDIENAKKKLMQEYDGKVVEKLFSELESFNLPEITQHNLDVVKLHCHYFEIKKELSEFLETCKNLPLKRVMNYYLRHLEAEFKRQVSNSTIDSPVTIEQLDRAKINACLFLNYLPELLNGYSEWICYRSLNHILFINSEALCGLEPLPSLDCLYQRLEDIFGKEKQMLRLIEAMPYEAINKHFELLEKEALSLSDPQSSEDVRRELLLKSGRLQKVKPLVSSSEVAQYAKLFKASTEATDWAHSQDVLLTIDSEAEKNINDVFFLKSNDPERIDENVAVFKWGTVQKLASGAMESFAYDTALLFGLGEGLVPTKMKKLEGMNGSIQVFSKGMSYEEFEVKSLDERKEILSRMPLKNFLQGALAGLLIGNRDVHMKNFLISKNENDDYGIVLFDNEYSFEYTNYILSMSEEVKVESSDKTLEDSETPTEYVLKRASHFPMRCALLMFPHADEPITGETKAWLQKIVATWPQKMKAFKAYMSSPASRSRLMHMKNGGLNQYQMNAFTERVEKLMYFLSLEKDYTYRELIAQLYPFFPSFFTLTSKLYSEPEFWIGTVSAEKLCRKAIKENIMTRQEA